MKWPYTHLEVDGTVVLLGTWAAIAALYWALYRLQGSAREKEKQADKLTEKVSVLEQRVHDLEKDSSAGAIKTIQQMIEGKRLK